MAEKNYFQESFKAIKTVRISKFIWQQVPDCRAMQRDKKPEKASLLIACKLTSILYAASCKCHTEEYRVAPKCPNFNPYLRQILTDFQFFNRNILWKICSKVVVKYSTTF